MYKLDKNNSVKKATKIQRIQCIAAISSAAFFTSFLSASLSSDNFLLRANGVLPILVDKEVDDENASIIRLGKDNYIADNYRMKAKDLYGNVIVDDGITTSVYIGAEDPKLYNSRYVKENVQKSKSDDVYMQAQKQAHEENRIYMCITDKSGNDRSVPVESAVCVRELNDVNNDADDKYYVLENDSSSFNPNVSDRNAINLLDGKTIDHNFDANNIEVLTAENYITIKHGSNLLPSEQNSLKQVEDAGCLGFTTQEFENSMAYKYVETKMEEFRTSEETQYEQSIENYGRTR